MVDEKTSYIRPHDISQLLEGLIALSDMARDNANSYNVSATDWEAMITLAEAILGLWGLGPEGAPSRG